MILRMLLVILLLAIPASATVSITLDLDADHTTVPDTIDAELGDIVSVVVWVTGNEPQGLISVAVTLCNLDGALNFLNYQTLIGPPWTITPPVDLGAGCTLVQATDWTFSSLRFLPFPHGWATYQVAMEGLIREIVVDAGMSGYFTYYGCDGCTLDEVAPAFVNVIPVATGVAGSRAVDSNWSEVKQLFR